MDISINYYRFNYPKFETLSLRSQDIYYIVDYTPDTSNITVSTWKKASTLNWLYLKIKDLKNEQIFSLLKERLGIDCSYLSEVRFLDIKKLATLVLWIRESLGIEVLDISPVEDIETGEPQFIAIRLKDCNWEEWGELARFIKRRLIEEGFDDIAGRVAVVCNRALQIMRD